MKKRLQKKWKLEIVFNDYLQRYEWQYQANGVLAIGMRGHRFERSCRNAAIRFAEELGIEWEE